MNVQLWGTCQECQHRKRLRKDGLLYNHKAEITDPGDELYGARRPCYGGGEHPAAGTARSAAGDTPEELRALGTRRIEKVDVEFNAPWANGKSREEIVNELRELITNHTGNPDIVERETETTFICELYGDGFWDRYYWCVVGSVGLILLAVGAFAGGVVWGRR